MITSPIGPNKARKYKDPAVGEGRGPILPKEKKNGEKSENVAISDRITAQAKYTPLPKAAANIPGTKQTHVVRKYIIGVEDGPIISLDTRIERIRPTLSNAKSPLIQ